jgi:hypothetical protein
MSVASFLMLALYAGLPDTGLPAAAPVPLATVSPCLSVQQIIASSTGPRYPFSTLQNPDRSVKPLPGVERCRVVFSDQIALVCLGEGLPESATVEQQTSALNAYADTIGQCLPAADYTRGQHDDNAVPALSYGAGARKPFFQFSMTSQIEGNTRLLRPELMVLGPNEMPVAAAPKAKPKLKLKTVPARRKTRS